MSTEIGVAAGDVYRFLEAHGPATLGQVKKATGHRDTLVHQAMGWLAREDNVACEQQDRALVWQLTRR